MNWLKKIGALIPRKLRSRKFWLATLTILGTLPPGWFPREWVPWIVSVYVIAEATCDAMGIYLDAKTAKLIEPVTGGIKVAGQFYKGPFAGQD